MARIIKRLDHGLDWTPLKKNHGKNHQKPMNFQVITRSEMMILENPSHDLSLFFPSLHLEPFLVDFGWTVLRKAGRSSTVLHGLTMTYVKHSIACIHVHVIETYCK